MHDCVLIILGGESIWSKPFKDEIHSRLRFVRRGLLAMANSGKDDNGSQFFFTLAPTRELQNKHTIFGKVVGDTIFNMLRLSEGHLEDGDRPKYPHKIIRTRVLINPFNDITPRETIQQEIVKTKKSKPESKMKGTKDFKLLSFGEEAEDDEESLNTVGGGKKSKGKSAHDLADDPQLLANADKQQLGVGEDEGGDSEEEEQRKQQELNSVKERLLKRKAEKEMLDIRTKLKKTDVVEEFIKEEASKDDDDDLEYECPIQKEKQRRKDEIQAEYKALAKELKPKKQKEKKQEEEPVEKVSEAERNNDMLRTFHTEQKKYKEKTKGNVPTKKASREDATLAMLAKFKQKLVKINDEGEDESSNADNKEVAAKDDEDEDLTGDNWMKNTLRFESNDPVLAKDASTKVSLYKCDVYPFNNNYFFLSG